MSGDVVVGRVVEVQDKRWRIDLSSRQDAILMLSSVNLPGFFRRTEYTVFFYYIILDYLRNFLGSLFFDC